MPATRKNADQFLVRLPDGVREEIKAAAAASGRSMNAEIILRLKSPPAIAADFAITIEDYIHRQVAERLATIERDRSRY